MRQLRPIINVREIPPLYAKVRHSLPGLRSLVQLDADPREPKIQAYLRQGVLCGIYYDRGLLRDVLSPEIQIDPDAPADKSRAVSSVQPNVLLTDGTWVWPGALPYYLATYHIRLPAEFIAHAEQRGWKIEPAAVSLDNLNCDLFDAAPAEVASTPRPEQLVDAGESSQVVT